MIVSRKHRLIYVGINKTATTSIESVLRPYRSRYFQKYLRIKHQMRHGRRPAFKHVPAAMARDLVGSTIWEKYFTFTFVRNPWDRVLSEFSRHRYNRESDIPMKQAFTEWVAAGGNWLARHNTMSDFVSNENGDVIVDFIGKIESLESDLAIVLDKVGVPHIEMKHLNRSDNKPHYREIYTRETREIVTQWVQKDADMFGYSF